MSYTPLSPTACMRDIFLRQCRFLEARYPALKDIGLPLTPHSAADVFETYCWHVKRIDPAAGALDRVNLYENMIPGVVDAELRDRLLGDLVDVQAARGVAQKVRPLLKAGDDRHREKIDALCAEHVRHYGFDQWTLKSGQVDRGSCLRLYFNLNPEILKGKRVLHFAPELKIRTWMREAAQHIGFTYATADGFINGMDHYVDLCAIRLDDAQFDIVIMHRVLEHVIDDAAALSELRRLLVPGGILNISVPEILYLEDTSDWRVPDPKMHMHFRNYGRSFPAMLDAAGFTPNRCDWLFEWNTARLLEFNAYPMRFYNAIKA